MSLGRLARRPRQEGDINVSPLIDMVFILLIFFMVTTTFVRDAQLEVQRPGAQTAERADNRALRVSVGMRGELYVDASPVQSWMLQARVREQLARQRIQTVLVIADTQVPTGTLVEVVDQCRLAGAQEVAVAVERAQ